jgi:hypothetical protein
LVAAHFFHDKVEEAVNKLGPLDPHKRIAKWAVALSEVIKDLAPEELAKFRVLADKWNKEGPPKDVRRK